MTRVAPMTVEVSPPSGEGLNHPPGSPPPPLENVWETELLAPEEHDTMWHVDAPTPSTAEAPSIKLSIAPRNTIACDGIPDYLPGLLQRLRESTVTTQSSHMLNADGKYGKAATGAPCAQPEGGSGVDKAYVDRVADEEVQMHASTKPRLTVGMNFSPFVSSF